jgi:hypothetical protein
MTCATLRVPTGVLPLANEIEDLKDRLHETLLKQSREEPATGCWLWQGARDARSGTGFLRVLDQLFQAGRVALWVYYGQELAFSLFDTRVPVRRGCGTPSCVNPDHWERSAVPSAALAAAA